MAKDNWDLKGTAEEIARYKNILAPSTLSPWGRYMSQLAIDYATEEYTTITVLSGFSKEETTIIHNLAVDAAYTGAGSYHNAVRSMVQFIQTCRPLAIPKISFRTRIKFKLMGIKFWMKDIWNRIIQWLNV